MSETGCRPFKAAAWSLGVERAAGAGAMERVLDVGLMRRSPLLDFLFRNGCIRTQKKVCPGLDRGKEGC